MEISGLLVGEMSVGAYKMNTFSMRDQVLSALWGGTGIAVEISESLDAALALLNDTVPAHTAAGN